MSGLGNSSHLLFEGEPEKQSGSSCHFELAKNLACLLSDSSQAQNDKGFCYYAFSYYEFSCHAFSYRAFTGSNLSR